MIAVFALFLSFFILLFFLAFVFSNSGIAVYKYPRKKDAAMAHVGVPKVMKADFLFLSLLDNPRHDPDEVLNSNPLFIQWMSFELLWNNSKSMGGYRSCT